MFRGEKKGSTHIAFLTDIKLPEYELRKYYDRKKLEELAQSIKIHGILEPLIVRKIPGSNLYELVGGGRRYRSAELAGLLEVPIVILDLTDSQALEVSIVENAQREDLNPIEETEGIIRLLAQRLKIQNTEVSPLLHKLQKELKGRSANNVIGSEVVEIIQTTFESLAMMELDSFISNRLPLLKLPEDILQSLREGKIEYTKAKAIAKIKDDLKRKQLLNDVISQSLSLNQIRSVLRELIPSQEQEQLKNRFESTYKQAKKSKLIWSNPKKRKQLESLLTKLEKILSEET